MNAGQRAFENTVGQADYHAVEPSNQGTESLEISDTTSTKHNVAGLAAVLQEAGKQVVMGGLPATGCPGGHFLAAETAALVGKHLAPAVVIATGGDQVKHRLYIITHRAEAQEANTILMCTCTCTCNMYMWCVAHVGE